MLPDLPKLTPKVYLVDLSLKLVPSLIRLLLCSTHRHNDILRGLYLMIQIHTLPDLDLFSGKLILKSVNGSAASLYM